MVFLWALLLHDDEEVSPEYLDEQTKVEVRHLEDNAHHVRFDMPSISNFTSSSKREGGRVQPVP